jgi:hypothetical protein
MQDSYIQYHFVLKRRKSCTTQNDQLHELLCGQVNFLSISGITSTSGLVVE